MSHIFDKFIIDLLDSRAWPTISSRPAIAPISELLPDPVAPITAINAFALRNGFVTLDEPVEVAIGVKEDDRRLIIILQFIFS